MCNRLYNQMYKGIRSKSGFPPKSLALLLIAFGAVAGIQKALADTPSLQWAKGQGTALGEHVIEGIQTSDGGFCLVGKTDEPGREWSDGLVIKIDDQGDLEWQRSIGLRKSQEEARCICEVEDGYLVGGTLSNQRKKSQAGVCKLDRGGKVRWTMLVPHARFGAVRGLAVGRDGNLIGTGYTDFEDREIPFIAEEAVGLLFAADEGGNLKWQRQLPVVQGSKVEVDPNTGAIAVCGTEWRGMGEEDAEEGQNEQESEAQEGEGEASGDEGEHQDGCLLLMDARGRQEGLHYYGGSGMDQFFDMEPTDDGWVLAGHSTSGGTGWDAWIVRVDKKGELLWQKRFGQPLGGDEALIFDECYGVKQASDGGYVMACGSGVEPDNIQNENDKRNVWAAYLIKTDDSGNRQWEYTYHRPDAGHNACEWVIPVREGGYLMLLDSDHLGDAAEENIGLLKLGKSVEDS